MQTILGSNEPIGIELAKALTKFTSEIRLVSRNPQKVNANDKLMSTDLTIRNNVYKAVEGSDVVYVTVSFPFKADIWEKLWPPFIHNVIKACMFYHSKLVFIDNIYLYDPDYIIHMTEDTPIRPISRKGLVSAHIATKISNEFENDRIDLMIARAPDIIADSNSIMGNLIFDNILNGKKAICLLNSTTKRNAISMYDIANATAILGNTPEAFNQVWHLPAISEALSGSEWVDLFARETGQTSKFSVINENMLMLLKIGNNMLKEVEELCYLYKQDYFFDSTKFLKAFKYSPLTAAQAVKYISNNNKPTNN